MASSTAATPETTDGPVLNLINKRIRALRKKLNRIIQMEDSLSLGKPINKEQEEVLRSKPAVVALIDELDKLRLPLSDAVVEELSLAANNSAPPPPPPPSQPQPEPTAAAEPSVAAAAVDDLLSLLYFGSLFDVKPQSDFAATMLTRTHERGCCLTYDYVTDDATDPLREADLDSISRLGGMLISRPVDSSLSHRDALLRCLDNAKLWLSRSHELVEPSANITYAELRERLDKIMASDYLTTTPEMKATVEVAAAAAAGDYAPFHVPNQGSVSPVPVLPVLVEVESSAPQYQQQDETTSEFQGHESFENQSSAVDEYHQVDEPEPESERPSDPSYAEQDQTRPETDLEYGQRDFDSKDQQYQNRRPYQNQRGGGRGGGRRGYPTGRGSRGSSRGGGGPYQNGGRNQYFNDQQPGGYYPTRNNYYNSRGRGGRGGGGPSSYNNHGSVAEGGQFSTSVGAGY